MIGISSSSAGVLLLPKTGIDEFAVFDLLEGVKKEPLEAQYLYSASQDWEEIEGINTDNLLEKATSEFWLARTVSYLRLAIGGLEESLEKRVLEQVEETLASRVSPEKALNRLLIAPLCDPNSTITLAHSALSKGFSAVASILDELAELQPLLRRLTDLWLGLPETIFNYFPESKEMIWVTAVDKCGIKQLLRANNSNDFNTTWNRLVFNFKTPQSISGVNALGQELSQRLYPHMKQNEIITTKLMEGDDLTPRNQKEQVKIIHEVYKRVEKEVNAITKAVSKGQDTKAKKFLRELIQEQTSFTGGEDYAVKSLCNIAQRCADMFRMDFEEVCLNEALSLLPSDPWTLIQHGDHLKRIGSYDEALKVLDQAEKFGERIVAKSSIADVFSHQGNYEEAIRSYKAIPNFNDKPEILNAIADNYRKMGVWDKSEDIYRKLIELSQQGLPEFTNCGDRALVGIAEIAKKQGKLEIALKTYDEIISRESSDERDLIFNKLGLCNVLKLMEKFEKAYEVVDEIIQKYPFAMQARFTRGSILGLIGKELEGLNDLPESIGSLSWREWVRPYFRGLLLLKLERYDDAKLNLVDELSKAIASGEEKAILRMAAALYHLNKDEIPEVDGILSNISDLHDYHAQYLSLVLKLHLATKKDDIDTMKSLKNHITMLNVEDPTLNKAVKALYEKNFDLALKYKTDSLLKLAA